jgi:hypothetical protein
VYIEINNRVDCPDLGPSGIYSRSPRLSVDCPSAHVLSA